MSLPVRLARALGAALLIALTVAARAASPALAEAEPTPANGGSTVVRVASRDATAIAVECAGSGPTLLMVHGGIGDRRRWTPMIPLLSPRFTACAMDRRGHGESADSPDYDLSKEAEDVAAVVGSLGAPVFVLGHSYGGVAALEAAFLTGSIAKLILYEPPLEEPIDVATIETIERLIGEGKREQAALTFLREVVMLSEEELEATRGRPSWEALVASIDSHPRQMRALAAYRFDPARMSAVTMPTLLLLGGDTASPHLKKAIASLQMALPKATTVVLEGQEHNAMDRGREQLAAAVVEFLLAAPAEPRD